MRIPTLRTSARVLVVDAAARVLLFRGYGGGTRRTRPEWTAPGGRVGPREPLAVAAARELREETGLAVAPEELGRAVAVGVGAWRVDDEVLLGLDWHFYLGVRELQVDSSGWDVYEREMITGFRWWSTAEIRRSDERIFPYGLAELIDHLVRGDVPPLPEVLRSPW
ncbi:NUDIX domain-containing protein [Thermopolyspora sp. NPDC052614]|uniref:NUDIX hydrolase n=1 Tax=Thermopolyspora sp. NPDC052614 TaxID=3155682 RepID=UPI0034280312